jgi:phage FluMu protein Com
MKTTRRQMLILTGGTVAGLLLTGSPSAHADELDNKENGSPWRCGRCGKLLRSHEDMTGKRCPRCFAKKLAKISEEELQTYRR